MQKSRGKMRRERLERLEAEREAQIAKELEQAGPSARAAEEEALQHILLPLGLRIIEIPV